MNKKIIVGIVAVLVLISSISGGFYVLKKNEQSQVVEWEKVAARRLKKQFVNIKEIYFLEKYNYNHLAGFVSVSAEITTNDVKDIVVISLPVPENKDEGIGAYGKPIKLKLGETKDKVKVVYSDLSEEEI
ncbi:hypothetical protein [Enterococcus sp. LJL51]|uniref:hypothetical protein n=1 Tax=Enterococcus sp. LJL51 TaxID=3416656 RepID=UPI003CF34B1F